MILMKSLNFLKNFKSIVDLINAEKKVIKITYLRKKNIKNSKRNGFIHESSSFYSSTIEALMEALYELNKKLLLREGKMLRMATSAGVKREEFIDQYLNFNFEKTDSKSFIHKRKKLGKNLLTEIILK